MPKIPQTPKLTKTKATDQAKAKDPSQKNPPKKVSVNAHDPIKEQLENLTSMVYNMSIQKEDNNRPFKSHI